MCFSPHQLLAANLPKWSLTGGWQIILVGFGHPQPSQQVKDLIKTSHTCWNICSTKGLNLCFAYDYVARAHAQHSWRGEIHKRRNKPIKTIFLMCRECPETEMTLAVSPTHLHNTHAKVPFDPHANIHRHAYMCLTSHTDAHESGTMQRKRRRWRTNINTSTSAPNLHSKQQRDERASLAFTLFAVIIC